MPDLCGIIDPAGLWCQWIPSWGDWKREVYDWLLFSLLPGILLWAVARYLAWQHERDLGRREAAAGTRPLLLSGEIADGNLVAPRLLCGSVALSHAAIRSLPVLFRQIFGGRIPVLEAMVRRARREAVLRSRMAAQEAEVDVVLNVRFETHRLRGVPPFFGGALMAIEVVAFGTGLRRADVAAAATAGAP